MSQIRNELRSNNTSGVPGLRLRWRARRTAARTPVLEIDVSWPDAGSPCGRRFTSYTVGKAPVDATRRAMQRREREAGVRYEMSPRAAWLSLRRQLAAGGG